MGMIINALLACTFGFMLYFLVPVVAIAAPVRIRHRVGTFYLKNGARVLKQFAFIRRTLSGYDILPINVDNEQKLLKLTLSGSHLSDDEEYRFSDPDNRIKRLFSKPVALAFELVPAAVDADLAEWGYWTEEKEINDGLDYRDENGDDVEEYADPYVPASNELRLVDPLEAFNLVPKSVNPENILTAEKLTEERKSLFDQGMGLAESMRVLLGFGAGFGAVMAFTYVQTQLLDGEGLGMPAGSEVVGMVAPDAGLLVDAVVMTV